MTYMVISWYSDGSGGSPVVEIAPTDTALVRIFETINDSGKRFRVFRFDANGLKEIGTTRPE